MAFTISIPVGNPKPISTPEGTICRKRNRGTDEKTSRRELADQQREPIGQENEIKPERTGPKLESQAVQQ